MLADYGDLDTRHLGSVYEGLLEHHFRIAPEQYAAVAEDGGQVWKPADEVTVADAVETVPEGGLYVVNDEGERKATGAYYTPDYVVTYIVEETVGPLVDEIREDLEDQGFEPGTQEYLGPFSQRVTDLKILDPAMGSGHFLTRATEYLANEVMSEVRDIESELGVAFDEQHVRRQVAKDCIYGVDINGMAVELAKLSMWLETLAADRPLAFLDHHLKSGNSLVGSDVTDVLTEDTADDGGQLTLTQALARVREETLEHVMEMMEDLLKIDNETLADIRSMEEIYDDIRADPLYQRLFGLTNVHTAEQFGLDVPEGAYEEMASAIKTESDWAEVRESDWYKSAQAMAVEESFFHWELEYPAAFFDNSGHLRDNGGFDAVLSNPPYIRIQTLRSSNPELADYLTSCDKFATTEGRFDIYSPFVEQGSRLASDGRLSYILPNKFFERKHGAPLRGSLVEQGLLEEIVDFGQHQVFEGVTTYTCILSLLHSGEEFDYIEATDEIYAADDLRNLKRVQMQMPELGDDPWALTGPEEKQVLDQLQAAGSTLGDIADEIAEGITSGDNDVLFVEILDEQEGVTKIRSPANDKEYRVESDILKPLLDGDNISRYGPPETDFGVIYPYVMTPDGREILPEETLEKDCPLANDYLSAFKERLANRGTETTNKEYDTWYSLYRAREMEVFENEKLVTPDVCGQSEFTVDDEGGLYFRNSAFGVVPDRNTRSVREFLLSILNSSITWFYVYHTGTVLENDFRRFTKSYLEPLPIPESDLDFDPETRQDGYEQMLSEFHETGSLQMSEDHTPVLAYLGRELLESTARLQSYNRSFLDHIGTFSDGQDLSAVGFSQPPEGVSESILTKTTEQHPNLQIGEVQVIRESATSVTVRLTARYKPDPSKKGKAAYAETEPQAALYITDLSEAEADLIEHFIPVAVDKAGGFANFRKNATKTNSLVDRLQALTLPAVDDVRQGLDSYLETNKRAEELIEEIERIDNLIDQIVYDLYGLNEEQIKIVESSIEG